MVLVHGLWHQPGHFDEVARRHRQADVDVAVAELHRGSLAADTAAVQQVADAMSRPPIVLDHSYGGSVITALPVSPIWSMWPPWSPPNTKAPPLWADHISSTPSSVAVPDGRTELDPKGAVRILYGDCPPDDAARAVALLRLQAPGHGRGIPERAAWRTVPSTYVICTDDHAIDPAIQQRLATRCGTILSWATSHSPFCSRPELVVDLLTDLLRRHQPTTM